MDVVDAEVRQHTDENGWRRVEDGVPDGVRPQPQRSVEVLVRQVIERHPHARGEHEQESPHTRRDPLETVDRDGDRRERGLDEPRNRPTAGGADVREQAVGQRDGACRGDQPEREDEQRVAAGLERGRHVLSPNVTERRPSSIEDDEHVDDSSGRTKESDQDVDQPQRAHVELVDGLLRMGKSHSRSRRWRRQVRQH